MNRPSAGGWAERYEAVRQHALGTGPLLPVEPLGLAILVHYGIAGWMHRWPEAAAGINRPGIAPIMPPCSSTSVWQQQLAVLLAQMSLPHLAQCLEPIKS